MAKPTVHDRLTKIEEALVRVEANQAAFPRIEERQALISPTDVKAALDDVLQTLNLVGQMAEIHTHQRDQLSMLVGLAAQLLTEARQGQRISQDERDELTTLLVQLRELGRKHVAALVDLERAIEGADAL